MSALLDLRFAFRTLRRAPGFAVVAISTLALGIGASITIFTVFNAALLRPLPYRDPEQVVRLFEKRPAEDAWTVNVSPLDYLDWRERSRGFADMAAHVDGFADLTGDLEPERVTAGRVTASFFRVLGVDALEGRIFADGEDEPGRDRVVLVSYGLWQRRFGGAPDLVGRTLILDGEAHVVAGILPPSFWFLERDVDVFRPLVLASEEMRTRSRHFLTVVARLEPGFSLEKAREEMDRVGRDLEDEYPETNEGHGAQVTGLGESLTREVMPALQLLLLGALSLLLIGCANVANLLLARGGARLRELSIREFVGAGRGRLVVQLVTESLLLSLLAGLLGLLLAAWSLEWLPRLLPTDGPGSWLEELPIEARDSAGGLAVIVINETMANRYWPNQRAIGRRVRLVGDETWREVVGVVRDVKYWGLDRETNPEMFLPHAQFPFRSMAVALTSRGEPARLVPAVRAEVRRLDPSLPISGVATMEELRESSLSSRRFNAVLLGAFAATAILLATVGVSSVTANALSQRTRELGIRVALGAPPRELLSMVLAQGLVMTGAGVTLGLALVLALSQLLRGLLFRVSPNDPLTLGATAALLLATALLASYFPARRALRVGPVAALRQE